MKTLLRSTFVGRPEDDTDLLLRNYQALKDSALGFEVVEDNVIWNFIQDFVTAHQHVPEFATVRGHFNHLHEEDIVNRLEVLVAVSVKVRGNFIKTLEVKVDERKTRQVVEMLKEASQIVTTGILKDEGKGKEKRHLQGPQDAVKFIMEQGHDIVTPNTGVRLSGNVTADGDDFMREYDRAEADPLAGTGQFTGIAQIDNNISGAKRGELWTHAAFTGGLKCVAGDTRIFDLNTGRLRTVMEVFESGDAPVLHALDEAAWGITTAQASPVVESGVREILRVVSDAGREVRVSDNHPFMTPEGWLDAGDLKVGDWVAVPDEMPYEPMGERFSDHAVALIGYMLGDGTFADQIGFCNGNDAILSDFITHLEALGYCESKDGVRASSPMFKVYPRGDSASIKVSKATGGHHHPWISKLRVLADHLGLYGTRSASKFIPPEFWGVSDRQVWLFMSALWSTDGRVGVDRTTPGRKPKADLWYGTRSKKLAVDLQLLLQRVGVPSTVSKGMVLYKGSRRPFWTVLLTSVDGKRRFLENTRIVGKEEVQQEALSCLGDKTNTDWMPPSLLRLLGDAVRAPTRTSAWHYAKWAKRKGKLARDTVIRLAEASGDPDVLRKARGRVRWERITSVDLGGVEMTYDLEVPGPANFVANGFITHNSTFAINWAYNQAVYYKHSVAIFSLEMPYYQDRRIIYAIHSAHPKFEDIRKTLGIGPCLEYSKIRDGNLDRYTDDELNAMSDEEQDKLLERCKNPMRPEYRFLRDHVVPDLNEPKNEYGSIYIEVTDPDKSDYTVADLRAAAEILYSKDPGIRMVIVDHAGLMSPRHRHRSTTENLNEVLRDLKRMSMNFNRGLGIAVVTLFQISREGYKAACKSDGRYNLTHLSYANEAERCLNLDSRVVTPSGVRPIGSILPGDFVWSSTGWCKVFNRFNNGIRRLWSVKTDRGSVLEATAPHRVRVIEDGQFGWKAVQDLTSDDYVAGAFGGDRWPDEWPALPPLEFRRYEHRRDRTGDEVIAPDRLVPDLAYLLGAWDGDGKVHPDGIAFTGNRLEVEIRDGLRIRLASCFSETNNLCESPSRPGSLDIRKYGRPVKRWFEAMAGPRALVVPEVILRAPKAAALAYLRGLFDTDGWLNKNGIIGINMKGASEGFLRDVQMLLTGLGIDSHLSTSNPLSKQTGKRYSKVLLRIRSREGRAVFATSIGFTDAGRQKRLQEFIEAGDRSPQRGDVQVYPVPETFLRVYRLVNPPGTPQTRFKRSFYNLPPKVRDSGLVPIGAVTTLLKAAQEDGIDNEDVMFLGKSVQLQVMRVVSVEDTGRDEPVVDLEVEGDHEYQTGPVLSHNSSDIVTTTFVDDDLKSRGLVRWQCLKTRDDEPFKYFYSSVLWPCRLMHTCHDVSIDDACKAGEKLDTDSLLDDMD